MNITGMSAAAVANLRVGQSVSVSNIQSGTIITQKFSNISIGISQAVAGTGTSGNLFTLRAQRG